ncbi:hypothetical protein [Aquabacterium sp. OR-4]|uniref:hypothetical protein n=1 Tax=Aquabacterium sp. OR-4 TaxID=2978127 RepID=UPI0021B48D46|nr:hypothetical protein [Aquabacterium sp. OR-4]MDT7836205.1 hypothetical protein [Aquabacterium sp. OR-4]
MQNEPTSRLPGEGQFPAAATESLSGDALARRRALLKGLRRGGVVLGAAVPLQSFAAPNLLPDNRVCSLSGAMSGVNSNTGTGSTCSGFAPEYYYTTAVKMFVHPVARNWPTSAPSWPTGKVAESATDPLSILRFKDLFGVDPVGADATTSVLDLLYALNNAPSVVRVWITAMFNALTEQASPGVLNFPYTPAEVRSQISASNAADYANFYSQYLVSRAA